MRKENRNRFQWFPLALCLAAVLALGAGLLWNRKPEPVSVGGLERPYGPQSYSIPEPAIEMDWPQEYLLPYEQHSTITYEGRQYCAKGSILPEALAGSQIGAWEVFSIHEIQGISPDQLIAANLGKDFYIYGAAEHIPPETLGEFLDSFSLTENLMLSRFSDQSDARCYAIADSSFIWQQLERCRDCRLVDGTSWSYLGREYLSFTATSDALGAYKKAFIITKDGYLWTNLCDWGYVFEIGKPIAQKIFAHALENAEEVPCEPYLYTLAGTLTEVRDGYLLIDDSVLCRRSKDGMVFKVSTDDLRIRRIVESGIVQSGDFVVVNFTDPIKEGSSLIAGAVSIQQAHLHQ